MADDNSNNLDELDNIESDVNNEELENQDLDDNHEEDDNDQDDNQEHDKDSETKYGLGEDDLSLLSDEEFDKYFDHGILPDNFDKRKGKPNTPSKEENENDKEDEPESKKDEKDDSTLLNNKKESQKQPNKEVNNTPKADSKEIDYKTVYEEIFKPLKAIGKEITPENAQDVRALMQMGVDYTKKMQTVAPMRKIVESLNKANINEEALNFLIDVHNGDKEAIKKLLLQHKVDPMELDTNDVKYTPRDNMISKEDLAYLEAIDDIKESAPKIREILETKWDSESKDRLLREPNTLRQLHEEIVYGRFDEIQDKLEKAKVLGRIRPGTSDLDAYIALVHEHVQHENNNANETKKEPEQMQKSKPKPIDSTVNKKAATLSRSTKPANSKSTPSQEDILAMSDEEILKLGSKYI